jgi:hypothetical protein
MKKINVSTQKYQNMFALVDDADFEWLSRWKWHAHTGCGTVKNGAIFYAKGKIFLNGKMSAVYMHRLIISAEKGQEVDHVNCNGLDNTRSNLRLCTRSQNCQNTRKITPTSSIYKGVSWDYQRGKWEARIKRKRIGFYEKESDAAMEYDKKAIELYGEFARPNFKKI